MQKMLWLDEKLVFRILELPDNYAMQFNTFSKEKRIRCVLKLRDVYAEFFND